MLVLGPVLAEALGAAVEDEPGRPARRLGQNGVLVSDAAIADPLLAAVQPVAGDLAVFDDRRRGRLQRAKVAACLRLGGAVGVHDPALGDLTEPGAPLLGGAAEGDRVAAEERGEQAGAKAEVKAGHVLADPVVVHGVAAHPAVFLGDEQQMHAKLVTAHGPDQILRADIVVVELELALLRHRVGEVLLDSVQHHLERLGVKTRRCLGLGCFGKRQHGIFTSPAPACSFGG